MFAGGHRWQVLGDLQICPQLYTIHGQKNGFTVPCVFALLPDKRKETYTRLFRQLKSWLSEFSTTWDFESCLAALAFIPVSDLVAVYEALSTTFLADEIPILHYFESTWIGMGVGAGGLRRDPAFPHQMWNVLNRHDQGSTRTTNALEAFHHSFNALISCQNPSIWTLLDSLKRQ